MRSIYKYPITAHNTTFRGPVTKILKVDIQYEQPVLWAEVDTDKAEREFMVILVGTGWNLDRANGKKSLLDDFDYINTIQFNNGSLVFHVYITEINNKDTKIDNTATSKTKPPAQEKPNSTPKNSKINSNLLKHFI